MLNLLPIKETLEENSAFAANNECTETLQPSLDYYKVIGFNPPWICFYAELDGKLVGSAGYKGKPVNNKIEIAYGTFESQRSRGIGKMICAALVAKAQQSDPSIVITARTLPEENHSTKILRSNGFKLLGTVWDKDDGNVWEWAHEDSE